MAEESCYFVIQVPDADRGQEFYGGLLGWSFAPGSVANSHQIDGMMGGLLGGVAEAAMKLYFDVPDIQTAAARVRGDSAASAVRSKRPHPAIRWIAATIWGPRSAFTSSAHRAGTHFDQRRAST